MDAGQDREVTRLMPVFPFPALVADIGGTNARFACLEAPDAPLSSPVRLATAEAVSFAAAVRLATDRGGFPVPRSLLVGAAGPVRDRAVRLTNAAWTINGPALARDLGLAQGILFNDFETLSLALPALRPADWRAIGPDRAATSGTLAVIGPGTGLGVGALVDAGGRWLPLSSEGGHVALAARDEAEAALWARLAPDGHRLVAERLLAGPGLARLHAALAGRDCDPATVSTLALSGADHEARMAVRRWLDALAHFSRDMALTFLATGGVYLAGGILPQMCDLIDGDAFRASFETHPTHQAVLETIPIRLIVAAEPALAGLSAFAGAPDRYHVDLERRLWR